MKRNEKRRDAGNRSAALVCAFGVCLGAASILGGCGYASSAEIKSQAEAQEMGEQGEGGQTASQEEVLSIGASGETPQRSRFLADIRTSFPSRKAAAPS